MNGKKAKQLRRMAEAKTLGRPMTMYERRRYHSTPLVLIPGCTRYVYKQLKRLYRK